MNPDEREALSQIMTKVKADQKIRHMEVDGLRIVVQPQVIKRVLPPYDPTDPKNKPIRIKFRPRAGVE